MCLSHHPPKKKRCVSCWIVRLCVVFGWMLSRLRPLLLRYAVAVDRHPARSAVPSVLRSNPPPARGSCTPSSTSWAAPSPASCCPAPSPSSSGKMWVLDLILHDMVNKTWPQSKEIKRNMIITTNNQLATKQKNCRIIQSQITHRKNTTGEIREKKTRP